jgi:hypoxanthine phosphoribosyltransferase
MKNIKISWQEAGKMIDHVSEQVVKSGIKFDGIYGIPRGGLPLAATLSHKLNIPLLVHPTDNCLLVDDISDTGKTLSNLKNKKIACLYSSSWTTKNPDFFHSIKTDKDSWIIFPWE